MAYICNRRKKMSCKGCPHYRYDEDYGNMACWATYDLSHKQDSKNDKSKVNNLSVKN